MAAREADYFYLAGDEISSSDVDYILDFSAASGDYVLLPIALQGSTYFALMEAMPLLTS